jgi:hypothetical protein
MRYSPLLFLLLTACSSIWADASAPLPVVQEVQPPSQEAIQKGVQMATTETNLARPVEISSPRRTDHGLGGYFVCLRESNQPLDKPRLTYSAFFDDVYKGSRLSVILEECETQQYTPVNMPPAAANCASCAIDFSTPTTGSSSRAFRATSNR